MEFFTFRINRLKIFDNREHGKAEVKLINFITPDDVAIPALDELFQTTDDAAKREIIKTATEAVLSGKQLVEIQNVKDGHVMTFGDTGYSLYTADKIPKAFNWSMLVIESDRDIRELGTMIDGIVGGSEFDDFVSNLLTLLTGAANPAYLAAIQVTKFAFKIIATTMIKKKDDQIGVVYQSFNRFQDYPHAERKRDGVPDLSNNMLIDYTIFGTVY